MQISVGIPAFNAADYLREAIESVLAQTYQAAEIIVCDDGSTDHTRQVCESFGSFVRYIYHPNDGTMGGTARRLAIAEARYDWVALLDQDDRWLPSKLQRQVEAALGNPEARAIFTRYMPVDSAGQPLSGIVIEETNGGVTFMSSEDAFHLLLRRNPYCPSSVLLDRNIFDRCGYADVRDPGCGDWDTWLRIARRFPIAVVDEYLTEYRVHLGGSCRNKHYLASGLELTLARQRPQLHPDCRACRDSFRVGERHVAGVFAVAARTYLDQYFGSAMAGEIAAAIPFLWGALQTSPREVIKPRRFLAVVKNLALGAARAGRLASVRQ